jgi:hypothetical protein
MASPEKVKEYFVVVELDKMYAQITQGMFNMMAEKFTIRGDVEEAEVATAFGEVHMRLQTMLIDRVAAIYVDAFTDEEIDEIIKFTMSPIMMKARDLTPRIQNDVLDACMNGTIDVNGVFEEVLGPMLESA